MKTVLLFEFFMVIQVAIAIFVYQIIWKSWKERK